MFRNLIEFLISIVILISIYKIINEHQDFFMAIFFPHFLLNSLFFITWFINALHLFRK